jgi:hypothetical protein
VFLEGVKVALVGPTGGRSLGSCGDAVSGEKEAGVRSWGKEERETGLKAFARVYAGWGFSQVGFVFYCHSYLKGRILSLSMTR